jgi:hypothetical protein
MVVRLSALRTRRTLHPRNIIIFTFLVLIYVRGLMLRVLNYIECTSRLSFVYELLVIVFQFNWAF